MNIPKIKRDETNTKIVNRDEIINYIKFYEEENNLNSYKNALLTQNKVSGEEVKSIIDAIDYRLELFRKYNTVRSDFNTLGEFYKDNLNYIKDCFKELYKSNYLASNVENILIDYLNYCVSKEELGIQNDLETQNIFNEYKYNYDSGNFKDESNFQNKVSDIMKRKDALLNKTDDNATDYKETNYLSQTQVLNLSPTINPGHSLTENNESQKYGGFIFTSIILQSSIVLALILSLIALFK